MVKIGTKEPPPRKFRRDCAGTSAISSYAVAPVVLAAKVEVA
jgi:hypothetical protein